MISDDIAFQLTDKWNQKELDIRELICCQTTRSFGCTIIPCLPATGTLYITNNNPVFISGQARSSFRY